VNQNKQSFSFQNKQYKCNRKDITSLLLQQGYVTTHPLRRLKFVASTSG